MGNATSTIDDGALQYGTVQESMSTTVSTFVMLGVNVFIALTCWWLCVRNCFKDKHRDDDT